ncbi:hypothetical protein BHE74_00047333 [Ensete ventricosum]|uniref:Uncharacterized protein n=1 Tax=Ensete ventricosum TaxID=4639 RepID=A0A444FEW9_ENSVE|nr:hypothetical protein B296_00046300 [Ensete ventricosum]RWW21174.1 hypothetical protein GW17_00014684 [Ensete ventricosum]RWW46724.1 hypothetical protein BHE74_00047333 [Ensete ventricosum]RZS12865.1 hypothetical protein BHM03_00044365 [Ensete ventricosum]
MFVCVFLTQKTKRSPKVEVGTRTTDANMDEWLEVNTNVLHLKDDDYTVFCCSQGTAYAQSLSSKSKKKK